MIRKFFGVLILVAMIAMVGLFLPVSRADNKVANFEPTAYSIGDINGQQGWSKTGAYDVAVAKNVYGFTTFGDQTLRLSSAVTSGSFGDQTFSMGLADEAGEIVGNTEGTPVGARQPHFDATFDFASASPSQQPGMHLSISPDRGDGARMSYLRFEDNAEGIDVFFSDVQGTTNPATFVETQVATGLSRTVTHTIRFGMNFINGQSNDVVYIFIDGFLVHTGTSWENYYRFDSESNPTLANLSRTVDKLLFREAGDAAPSTLGAGFLIDNVSLTSGPLIAPPTTKEQCKNNGWKTFNSPAYKNQGDCVSYVVNGR